MKITKLLLVVFTLVVTTESYAQDLLSERIWKISSRKRSIFLDRGVFHSEKNPMHQKLKGMRNSYVKGRGYERIVFDFSSVKPPKVYGHISSSEKKLYLDFFNTSIEGKPAELNNIKYLKDMSFFNIDKKDLSVELAFKSKVSFDIFYLENPGRIVIDVKK